MLSVSSNVHRHMLQHTEQVPPPIETDITSHTVTWHCQAEHKQTNKHQIPQSSKHSILHTHTQQSGTERNTQMERVRDHPNHTADRHVVAGAFCWWAAGAHTGALTRIPPSACDQGGTGASLVRCDTTCSKVTVFNGFVTGL